jgi:2-oxoglutarate ferredoxin oxidoreductase subunit alpha
VSFTAYLGHGDTEQIILLPGDVYECFEFGWKAFDIAERMQSPVFVLSDLDMGMNQWMSKPFKYPDTPMDRGKILWEEDLEKIKNNWGRYLDSDGDGIPYRTVPGNKHPLSAYLLRGTGHDEYARYTEDAPMWARNMDRLKKKYDTAENFVPKPVIAKTAGAKIGIIGYGSTGPAIEEARYQLEHEHGLKIDFMRLLAVPFTAEVDEFIKEHNQIFVVEMNRGGQMHKLLTVSHPDSATKLIKVAFNDGLPATAKWVRESIFSKVEGMKQKTESKRQRANGSKQKAEGSKRNMNGKRAAVKKAALATKKLAAKKVSVTKKGAK